MFYRVVKRLMDIAAGILGILIFGIPMAVVYTALKLENPGPSVFVRVRLGRGGKRFRMYKFASMITRTEEEDKKFIESWKKEDPELSNAGIVFQLKIVGLVLFPKLGVFFFPALYKFLIFLLGSGYH
ncbi:MAG TPA: hypothetical protein ENI09_00170 [candidate division WWE3 bacterium]|uniref:Bacterial sugar transferase domain-containing protein n=1 Tax=candidate division WWE3 bacterium TaxID=2053526 RepID=A0A7C1NMR3_UNCKA|nr:hypothetical protein [candidate division WWE3 bacterium]